MRAVIDDRFMEQVNGGADQTIELFGKELSREEFDNMIFEYTKTIGIEGAFTLLEKLTGYTPVFFRYGSPLNLPDADLYYVQEELKEFWNRRAQ